MFIAFYKGNGFVSRLIKFWTRSKYSHCELVFSNGSSFSADTKMPMHTRFANSKYMVAAEWDFIHIAVTKEGETKIKNFCIDELRCAYDWTGIVLSQFIPLGYHNKTKWFCSEVCVAALQTIGMLPGIKPNRVSPGKLHDLASKMTQK